MGIKKPLIRQAGSAVNPLLGSTATGREPMYPNPNFGDVNGRT